MVRIHKMLIGYSFGSLERFQSTIGRNLEGYKVQLKRLQKSYDSLLDKPDKNEVDKIILSNGKRMLHKGNEAIKYIYNHGYLSVIERSMNREEICIGRADEGNLRLNGNKIEIGVDKGIAYDLVEEDLYRYINRLQKKEINFKEEELIKIFVHESHLSFSSIYYLRGLCTYPRDFLRIWDKYIVNKKNKSSDEYLINLNRSMKYDDLNLIS